MCFCAFYFGQAPSMEVGPGQAPRSKNSLNSQQNLQAPQGAWDLKDTGSQGSLCQGKTNSPPQGMLSLS